MTVPDAVIDFFSKKNIAMLPCHGLKNGTCTCRRKEKCPSPGKHPLMPNWQGIATSNAQKVKSWFASGKPINLAIATGRKNKDGKYLVALDADIADHPFLDHLKQYGRTVTQKSGSGGSHALYWSDIPVKNSCQLLDEKLDVRGEGGILIIAPSKHKSGNSYQFTCDLEKASIEQMPNFLTEKLVLATSTTAQRARKRKKAEPRVLDTDKKRLAAEWATHPISQVRKMLEEQGVVVPYGIRNTTMHRLLSSERAKGADRKRLEFCALNYISQFDGADDFLDEVLDIIDSVLKYQPYNTSHERVNEIYTKWLEKQKIEAECPLDTLNKLDGVFFGALSPKNGEKTTQLSLKEIAELRERFFYCKGYQRISVYKNQLLAKKLVDIGAKRRRTSRNNLWEVSSCVLELEVTPNLSYPVAKENQMGEKVKDGDIVVENGKKCRIEILKRTIPVDEHPKEHLYQGRTGIDHNLALMKFMFTLSEEEKEAFVEGTLVSDTEATRKAIEGILPGDFLGLYCNSYRVASKNGDELSLIPVKRVQVKNKVGQFKETSEEPFIPTFPEVDKARALDLLHVLWRDGKPFGVDAEKNINILLVHPLNEEEQGEHKNDDSA